VTPSVVVARSDLDVVFHIPWVGPRLLPGGKGATGGAESQLTILIRELAAGGAEVGVVLRHASGPLPDAVDGIRLFPQRPSRPIRRIGPLLELGSIARAYSGIRASSLVAMGASPTLPYLGLVAKAKRWRLVWSAGHRDDFRFERMASSAAAVGLFRLGIRWVDEIVTQNGEQAELCESEFGRPATVIPPGIERASLRTAEPSYFLWLGRQHPIKRPQLFVELARRCPGVPFRMIASATSEHAGEIGPELIRTAGETRNLTLLEPRPREQLGALFDGAVALVSTSESEGFPTVFLDAWARGVPVIVLSHDPDLVTQREGLGWFAEGSMDRLAEITAEAWRNRHDQSELAERCREYVRRQHSPEAMASAWWSLLGLSA